MYKEIQAKTALHKLNSDYLPFNWDLNIYRGCGHRCQYCFALYSHKYLESTDYFGDIHVKTNIAQVLEQKICKKSWKKDIINLGGVTDSYQPAETQYRLMPDIWKLLIKYRTPAIISTKSALIMRDIDLIAELSQITPVSIAATIITTDENLQKLVEPGASSINDRFEMLKKMKEKTNVSIGIHMMPILPILTDSMENLEEIFKKAKSISVDYIITSSLNLYTETRKNYFGFLSRQFPDILPAYQDIFSKKQNFSVYKKELYEKLKKLRNKYQIPSHSKIFDRKFERETQQLSLF
ncbi:MAG: hypothetical protein A2X42_03405 [Candidatus Margulisbacteria bacterium GWF2_38_17]|nr:MAG: hypothetical protein A2X42_03405 [Candidatus Margulisbacteria bacterium GWF2_38_17]